MRLLKEFKEKWELGGFARPAEVVLLAVSGGSDSMVMADLFLKCSISFAVAHCNFGLRGEESDRDERLVRDWCLLNNITCHAVLFDTKHQALERKKGTQETARDLRYQWFEEIRIEHGYAKIVTAHHANDNVETMLINLLKGTGIGGLHGIRLVNGHIIRPLLFATKERIAAYAAEHSVPYRDDASNATDDYLRNAVRHHVIPAMQQWFPGVVDNVNQSISRFGEAEILYRKAIEQERKQLIEQRGQDWYIPIRKLKLRQPLATICYELLLPFGFSPGQAPEVIGLLSSISGHYVASATYRVIRNRDFLVVTALPEPAADLVLVESAPSTVETGKYLFSFAIKDKPAQIPEDKNEAWLDMKDISFPLVLRKWRNGDYLYPLGMKMKMKKVSRLLIDTKTALQEKEEIRLLECNKRIAWVSGIRIDERFKVDNNTKKVLVVKRTLK